MVSEDRPVGLLQPYRQANSTLEYAAGRTGGEPNVYFSSKRTAFKSKQPLNKQTAVIYHHLPEGRQA